MRTLTEKYNGVLRGLFSKDQFLRDARMEQSNLITQHNSYNDAVNILLNKGLISESVGAERFLDALFALANNELRAGHITQDEYEYVLKQIDTKEYDLLLHGSDPDQVFDKLLMQAEVELGKVDEGMTPEEYAEAEEAARLAKHPEKKKIEDIRAMLDKERFKHMKFDDPKLDQEYQEWYKDWEASGYDGPMEGQMEAYSTNPNEIKYKQSAERILRGIKGVYPDAEIVYSGRNKNLARVAFTIPTEFELVPAICGESNGRFFYGELDSSGQLEGGTEKHFDTVEDLLMYCLNPGSEISTIDEGPAKNNPKIEKLVAGINDLIARAVDSDGDPIGVVDPTTTWEEPYVYEPIQYKNGQLKITSKSPYQKAADVDIILARDMEFDGIPTLRLIMRMYKKAIKQAGKMSNLGQEIEEKKLTPAEKRGKEKIVKSLVKGGMSKKNPMTYAIATTQAKELYEEGEGNVHEKYLEIVSYFNNVARSLGEKESFELHNMLKDYFNRMFEGEVNESELDGYLAADVVGDIVKSIGPEMVKGQVENAPNRNYIYLKLTDKKFAGDVIDLLKSKFGIDGKYDTTFGHIPAVSFPSDKVVGEVIKEAPAVIKRNDQLEHIPSGTTFTVSVATGTRISGFVTKGGTVKGRDYRTHDLIAIRPVEVGAVWMKLPAEEKPVTYANLAEAKEEGYQAPKAELPLDVLHHGIRFELDKKGIGNTPTEEEYLKAYKTAAKNLEKDLLHYKKEEGAVEGPSSKSDEMVKAKLKESFKNIIRNILSENTSDKKAFNLNGKPL